MENIIVMKFRDGTTENLRIDPPRVRYRTPLLPEKDCTISQYLLSIPRSIRYPGYLLDSGTFPPIDNSWCNYYCSGCFVPLQASRQYWFDTWGRIREPYPRNHLDPAHFRSYPPQDGTDNFEPSECWHQWSSGLACSNLP